MTKMHTASPLGTMRALWTHWSPRVQKQVLDAGLLGRSDYVPFIILGRSRVGSNLLRGLLNAHPGVVAFGEIFKNASRLDWDHTGYFHSGSMQSLARRDPLRFLTDKVLGRYPSSIGAVGFKLFYYHAREGAAASIWSYIRDRPDVRVIHLKRANLLQTHVSRKRAALTGQWVNTSGRPDGSVTVSLDYEECLADFQQTRAWEEEADRYFAGHPMLPLQYEMLAGQYSEESRRIQEFLGVEPQPVTPSTFQQAREPLSAVIVNYAELKARFAGTEWAQFFTD